MAKESYEELIAHNVRDDAVLQSIGDGLIVIVDVDKGGKVAYVNKVFEDATGWKLEEVINKSIVQVLPREDKDGQLIPFKQRIVTKVLAGDKVVADLTQPFYYVRKDKTKFPVASVITPIILNKKIVGAVEIFRDISKESEADKAKTEFASLVSHQLRTPFATINWYVELLLTGDVGALNEKQKNYLEEVSKASQRMVALINVLLSVSRIEMGTMEIDKKMVDLVVLLDMIVDEERPDVQDKKLQIKKISDQKIPKIYADCKQLAIVMQNLLSNAVKYSLTNGKITIKIACRANEIIISIADNGMGIPKEAQAHMFERFFRAENAKAQEPEGIGLGLYIVKAVMEMMNGRVWFESQENKGATFYVAIPIKQLSSGARKK